MPPSVPNLCPPSLNPKPPQCVDDITSIEPLLLESATTEANDAEPTVANVLNTTRMYTANVAIASAGESSGEVSVTIGSTEAEPTVEVINTAGAIESSEPSAAAEPIAAEPTEAKVINTAAIPMAHGAIDEAQILLDSARDAAKAVADAVANPDASNWGTDSHGQLGTAPVEWTVELVDGKCPADYWLDGPVCRRCAQGHVRAVSLPTAACRITLTNVSGHVAAYQHFTNFLVKFDLLFDSSLTLISLYLGNKHRRAMPPARSVRPARSGEDWEVQKGLGASGFLEK